MQFNIGWFLHPFFINGDYPEIMKERIGEIRNQIQKPDEGLPKFTENEKTKNRGSCDFIRAGSKYSSQFIFPIRLILTNKKLKLW